MVNDGGLSAATLIICVLVMYRRPQWQLEGSSLVSRYGDVEQGASAATRPRGSGGGKDGTYSDQKQIADHDDYQRPGSEADQGVRLTWKTTAVRGRTDDSPVQRLFPEDDSPIQRGGDFAVERPQDGQVSLRLSFQNVYR